MDKIGVGYASVTDIEKRYVMDALDHERLSQGKYVAKFSTKFREQIKFWMLGLLNTNINSSSDEDW